MEPGYKYTPTAQDCEKFLTALTNYSEREAERNMIAALNALHPTLQQTFWRVMKQVIFDYAERPQNDRRNEASVEFCARIANHQPHRAPMHVGLPVV